MAFVSVARDMTGTRHHTIYEHSYPSTKFGPRGGRALSNAEHDEDARVAEVLRDVPRGAWILAGTSVGLLLFLWLLFFLFIFLGRPPVG
jgi:hypothetical protein